MTSETAVSLAASADRIFVPAELEVIIVPAGTREKLAAGTQVVARQVLGAAATVSLPDGRLARLGAEDSAMLGLVDLAAVEAVAAGPFSLDAVWGVLGSIYDPEIPVDIVGLGLIYRCEASELPDGTHAVEVDMSVTAPFCGMGDILRQEAFDRISALPGVAAVDVQLVFDPPWDKSRMSDAARLELGMW